MNRDTNHCRGFTLIELLVVIAIIAILAAILFPVFIAVKEKGRQTSCCSNMKQLGYAFTQYIGEWGTLPTGGPLHRARGDGQNPNGEWVLARSPGAGNNTMDIVHGSIFRYVRNTKVYICPSDKHATRIMYNTIFGLSYSMNRHLDPDYFNGRPVRESDIARPTRTALLIDEGASTTSTIVDGYYGPGVDDTSIIHVGGTNFAYCDGHVRWEKWERYRLPLNPYDHKPDRINFDPGYNG